MSKTTKLDFEASLEELTAIVEQMERGNLPLEQTLSKYERGMVLIQNCQKLLKAAEQKVQILSQTNHELTDYNESSS